MNHCRHLEYPDCSLYAMLQRCATRFETLPAIEYYGRSFTYAELLHAVDRFATVLHNMGIRQADSVSVILPNIPQAVIAFYAINRLGAVASMIHPLAAACEIEHAITLTNSKAVIALDLTAEKCRTISERGIPILYASAAEEMPLLMRIAYTLTHKSLKLPNATHAWHDAMRKATPSSDAANTNGDDAAAILFSGGTTGKPKGIVLSNRNFNALALQSIDACGCLAAGDRVLSVMPVFHGFGLGICIHTVLTFGGVAILLPQFRTAEFHKLVLQYHPNVIAGVPTIYEYLLRSNGFQGHDLSFLKCIISGGDSLSITTKQKLDAVFAAHGCKATIREGYGLTECVTGTCLCPEHCTKIGSVGLPYADTEYRIIHPDTGIDCPDGETGEILLCGPAVMKGYLHDAAETAKALQYDENGKCWLHTGDLGYKDAEGYIYFQQRRKRIIISNGYNIYPQGIENVLNAHPSVVMCAVVGMPDSIHGETVTAFVVPKPGTDVTTLTAELQQSCAEQVAAYAVPRKYRYVDALPRTLVGKIAYTELIRQGETHA